MNNAGVALYGTFSEVSLDDAGRALADLRGFERFLVVAPEVAARRIAAAILVDAPRLLVGRDAHALDLVRRFFPANYMRVLAPVLDPKKRFGRRNGASVA